MRSGSKESLRSRRVPFIQSCSSVTSDGFVMSVWFESVRWWRSQRSNERPKDRRKTKRVKKTWKPNQTTLEKRKTQTRSRRKTGKKSEVFKAFFKSLIWTVNEWTLLIRHVTIVFRVLRSHCLNAVDSFITRACVWDQQTPVMLYSMIAGFTRFEWDCFCACLDFLQNKSLKCRIWITDR